MEIGTRIKEVRTAQGITQQTLADKIGTTQNSIARYESGMRTPPNAVVALICREFNVNEEWLRHGTGEMFKENDVSILARLANEYRLMPEQEKLIRSFLSLNDAQRAAVVTAICKAAEYIQSDPQDHARTALNASNDDADNENATSENELPPLDERRAKFIEELEREQAQIAAALADAKKGILPSSYRRWTTSPPLLNTAAPTGNKNTLPEFSAG